MRRIFRYLLLPATLRILAAVFMLAACGVSAFAENRMPPFSVEAGDGVIRFENVVLQEHPYAGATVFNAVAVNRSGCDFKTFEVDLIFVAGEGDRFNRVTIENFKDGSSVVLSDRRVPGPPQEIQGIRGVYATGPMVCARAVARDKAEKERKAGELAKKIEVEAVALKKANAEKATRIATVKAKPFKAGFRGLFLGMSTADVDTLLEDPGFPWKNGAGQGQSGRLLHPRESVESNIGCDGIGEKRTCYEVKSVYLEFRNDRAVNIQVRSGKYSADNVDLLAQGWFISAYDTVKGRFGNPSRVYAKAGRLNASILNARSGASIVEWESKGEKVRIIGEASQSGYGLSIVFEEKAVAKMKEKSGGNGKKQKAG